MRIPPTHMSPDSIKEGDEVTVFWPHFNMPTMIAKGHWPHPREGQEANPLYWRPLTRDEENKFKVTQDLPDYPLEYSHTKY